MTVNVILSHSRRFIFYNELGAYCKFQIKQLSFRRIIKRITIFIANTQTNEKLVFFEKIFLKNVISYKLLLDLVWILILKQCLAVSIHTFPISYKQMIKKWRNRVPKKVMRRVKFSMPVSTSDTGSHLIRIDQGIKNNCKACP